MDQPKNLFTGAIEKFAYSVVLTLIPNLILYNATGSSTEFHYAVWAFFISYTICLFLFNGKQLIIFAISSLVIIQPVNIIELGWFCHNHSLLLQNNFWVIYNTNYAEATGLLSTLPIKSFILTAIHTMLCITVLIFICKRPRSPKKYSTIIGIVTLGVSLIILSIPIFRRNIPVISFYNNYRKYIEERKEVVKCFESRKGLNVGSYCYCPNDKKTFIIIIGESANRHHYHLYGYSRNTSPRLDSLKNELTIYTDVVTPSRSTVHSIQQILSYGSYENMERYKKDASVIEILRDAGYKTYWLDNQGIYDKGDYSPTAYRVIARMSHYFNIIPNSNGNDDKILPVLDSCLCDYADNKVIFVHLYGSHHPYETGVPKSFYQFAPTDTIGLISPFKNNLTKEDLASINMYDNSIYHNDYIVSEMISKLQRQEGITSLLYFPDHGEEMCETYNFVGRDPAQMSRSQCEIPFILWRNEKHKQTIKIDIDTTRAFCTDDAIYSIMDLTGVHHSGKDTTKSIFSSLYRPKRRLIEEKYDYDSLPVWK